MASIDNNYPASTLQFTNRRGENAAIDTSSKPLAVEVTTGADLVTIDNFQATGTDGGFTVDVTTLATGAVAGEFVADADMTPAGERELRVPFAFTIDPSEATGAAFSLSGGVAKP